MSPTKYHDQAAGQKFVTITKANAVRVVEALVLVFGIIPLRASPVLRHLTIFNFAHIKCLTPDELAASVKIALATAMKSRPNEQIPIHLDYEVCRVFGEPQGPLSFQIDNGSYYDFVPDIATI